MARKAHYSNERTFGRHEVKVVRRLKTADYLVNVDCVNALNGLLSFLRYPLRTRINTGFAGSVLQVIV